MNEDCDVLLVASNLGWGGTESHVQFLSQGLENSGVRVQVLAESEPTPRRKFIESSGVTVRVLGERPIANRNIYVKSVAENILKSSAKIVHGHGVRPEWLAAAAKQCERPCIITY